jgi:hypothetical protein
MGDFYRDWLAAGDVVAGGGAEENAADGDGGTGVDDNT